MRYAPDFQHCLLCTSRKTVLEIFKDGAGMEELHRSSPQDGRAACGEIQSHSGLED